MRFTAMFLNERLAEDASHKTVIVLDRSPRFAKSSGTKVISSFKDESGAFISSTLPKTLWNCSIEAALEFHRVVADLFPRGSKQLRFVVSDVAARFLTRPWSDSLLQHDDLLLAFSTCDLPSSMASDSADACSIMNGITMAVGVLSERTRLQERAAAMSRENQERLAAERAPETPSSPPPFPNFTGRCLKQLRKIIVSDEPKVSNTVEKAENEEGNLTSSSDEQVSLPSTTEPTSELSSTVVALEPLVDEPISELTPVETALPSMLSNTGTIIVLTALERSEQFDEINRAVLELTQERNNAVRGVADENLLAIDHVNLVVLNLLDADRQIDDRHRLNARFTVPGLRSTLTSVIGGEPLLSAIRKTLQDVYDLVSTTVSGIPMKEEAQQGQSINYDVELLHHRSAHLGLVAIGALQVGSRIVSRAAGNTYDTVQLLWSTTGSRLKSEKFPLLHSSHLVTPASVNSRPTVCLTSFALAGKCVMLEVQRDAIAPPSADNAKTDDGKPAKVDAKWLLPANFHQKLISHYLCRDAASGALAIRCVATGSKATMGGFLVPEMDLVEDKNKTGWRHEELNLSFMRHFMESAELSVCPLAITASSSLPWRQRMELTRRLRQNVWNLTQYSPLLLQDSFVFSFPEVFDSFLGTLRKPLINTVDFEVACKWIRGLLTLRVDGIEPLIGRECVFKGKRLPKEEQYRLIIDELTRLVNNSAHVSVTHFALVKTLSQTCGTPQSVPLPPTAPDLVAEIEKRLHDTKEAALRRKRLLTNEDRELTMTAKRFRKKFATTWRPNESINLLEHFTSTQQQNRWTKWKDFVGRENANGETQAKLYPNLKLPEPTPAAELPPEMEKVANFAAVVGENTATKPAHKVTAKPMAQQQQHPPAQPQQQQPQMNQASHHGKPPMGRGGQHHHGQSSHHDRQPGHMGSGGGGRGGGMRGKGHNYGGGAGHPQQPYRGGRGRGGASFGNRQPIGSHRGGGGPPPSTS